MSSSSDSKMSSDNNLLTGMLLVMSTASTITLGVTVVYLWRNFKYLNERLDVLESRTRYGSTHNKRRSSDDSARTDATRSSEYDAGVGTKDKKIPSPEVVVVGPDDALPLRFLNAGKGDAEVGRKRCLATLKWREENNINSALYRAWPDFELIKENYPHFFHGFGKNGEPVFFENPPKTDLKALRAGGVDLEELLHHYAMVCEFQWQYVSRDDSQRSIYIIDLEGMGMGDFVGECKEYVRQASAFTALHYPERAGAVLVINVPFFFKVIWNVVSNWVDAVTLKKIFILRGKDEIIQALADKIPMENIPPQYGGLSDYELGESPQEQLLRDLMKHNNVMEDKGACPNSGKGEPCKFCTFRYARNY